MRFFCADSILDNIVKLYSSTNKKGELSYNTNCRVIHKNLHILEQKCSSTDAVIAYTVPSLLVFLEHCPKVVQDENHKVSFTLKYS